jgi:hypothetical protein
VFKRAVDRRANRNKNNRRHINYETNSQEYDKIRQLLVVAALSGGITGALANDITGPSSSQSPYLLRTQPGVVTKSILTVGDSVNLKPDGITPYRMVGIPDGLGAFDNGDGTFTLLANHELPAANGIIREHGFAGAFVSKWRIEKGSLRVLHGEDLMQNAFVWDCASNDYVPLAAPFSRFCSADLPALSAFYNAGSGLGYNGRIYMNGEESGDEGRCFAHLMNGNSYELPWLGKFSHENSVANPATGNKTVVAGTDDTSPRGQVYIYIGDKTASADPIEAAGLKNGNLYGIKVTGFPQEDFTSGIPSGHNIHPFQPRERRLHNRRQSGRGERCRRSNRVLATRGRQLGPGASAGFLFCDHSQLHWGKPALAVAIHRPSQSCRGWNN